MGEKNNVMYEYLNKPEVFADFVNGSIFQGKQIIKPEDVGEKSESYNTQLKNRSKEGVRLKRERDVLKQVCRGNQYVIVGIENQEKVHPFMPLRCLEYDLLEYNRQLKALVMQNSEQKLEKEEFLSGIRKEDKLQPTITIVFYHGKEAYNGNQTLHEMLNFQEDNSLFRTYTADYPMNLITLDNLEEEYFTTGLRELVAFMKRSSDKKALWAYCQENQKRLSHMDEDTFETIKVMINQKNLLKYREDTTEQEGEVNMCKAIEDLIEDGRLEGIEQGIEQGIERGTIKTLCTLVTRGLLKLEDAAKYADLSEAAFKETMAEL